MATGRTLDSHGCEFGRMIRKDLNFFGEKIDKFGKRFDGIEEKMTELFNHQSTRLPPWTAVAISILTMIVGALLGIIGGGLFS